MLGVPDRRAGGRRRRARRCDASTGYQVGLFSGPSLDRLGGYSLIRYNERVATVIYPAAAGSHYVVACRGGQVSVDRDDVGVDAITAICP